MKLKRALIDPAFWLLLGINGYLVYHYYQHPEVFTTLIWLYWSQTGLMGFFNFLDILTGPEKTLTEQEEATINNSNLSDASKYEITHRDRVKVAFGFLTLFGILQAIYVAFIAVMPESGPFQWYLYWYFIIAFFMGQLYTFIQHKLQQKKSPPNLVPSTFVPFLRILPLHLTIVLPTFLKVGNMGFFLILKSLVDIIMYVFIKPAAPSKELRAASLSTQQSL